MEALSDKGLSIPEDISVVSYGAITNYSIFGPAVTGIHHMYQELGEAAARLALKKLNRLNQNKTLSPAEDVENLILSSDIVVGNSVKDLRK